MLREERSTRITQIFYFRFCQFLAEKTSHIFGGNQMAGKLGPIYHYGRMQATSIKPLVSSDVIRCFNNCGGMLLVICLAMSAALTATAQTASTQHSRQD